MRRLCSPLPRSCPWKLPDSLSHGSLSRNDQPSCKAWKEVFQQKPWWRWRNQSGGVDPLDLTSHAFYYLWREWTYFRRVVESLLGLVISHCQGMLRIASSRDSRFWNRTVLRSFLWCFTVWIRGLPIWVFVGHLWLSCLTWLAWKWYSCCLVASLSTWRDPSLQEASRRVSFRTPMSTSCDTAPFLRHYWQNHLQIQ